MRSRHQRALIEAKREWFEVVEEDAELPTELLPFEEIPAFEETEHE